MSEEFSPLKLGVITNPPAITLVYQTKSGKERQRIMPVRILNKYGPVDNIVKELQERHTKYLEKVPLLRLEKMLRILQETSKGREVNEAVSNISKDYNIDPNEDLNKVTDEDLAKKKKVMDAGFRANQLKPGDPDYVYDIQVDFSSSGLEPVQAGWDSPEDDFWS